MSAARNSRFLDLLRKVPGFGFPDELTELVQRHGPDSQELLQAIIDARLIGKEEACRQWAMRSALLMSIRSPRLSRRGGGEAAS